MIVADTTVFVDYLRGHPAAVQAVHAEIIDGPGIAASVLTRMELRSGVREGERRALDDFLALIAWIPVSEEIADAAGLLAGRFRRSHGPISPIDSLIGATALAFAADLWTSNTRHFPFLPGLTPPY